MFLSQSKASGVKMKTTLKNLCLTSVAVCAIGIAGLAITSESPEAQADTQIPGYTKHCPIYFFGALGGDLLFMTQNSSHCGSDYVWTDSWSDITFGSGNCGWPVDCLDPIFVDEFGQTLVLNEANDENNAVAGLKPIPETQKLPVESRLIATSAQKDYVAPRNGAPGHSLEKSGQFVAASDRATFVGNADFVVKADFGNDDVRYFRVLELKLKSDNSADSEVVRFGKELDPTIAANTVTTFEAKVVKANDQTHVLQLQSDQRKFLATTVTPVIAH